MAVTDADGIEGMAVAVVTATVPAVKAVGVEEAAVKAEARAIAAGVEEAAVKSEASAIGTARL
jgi:hypothetical protein